MRPFALTALLTGSLFCAFLVSGCSKYDSLERNAQYISDDLARANAQAAYENVVKTRNSWQAAGGGREADNQAYAAYKAAYEQYAILYNELVDRKGGGFSGYLHGVSDELPPPPPGVPATAPKRATPAPSPVSAAPAARDLQDDMATGVPMAPSPAAPVAPAPKTPAAGPNPFAPPATKGEAPAKAMAQSGTSGGNRYVIAPGDNLRQIAKRHGVSEKALMEANGITDPDKIAAGKTLVIPAH